MSPEVFRKKASGKTEAFFYGKNLLNLENT